MPILDIVICTLLHLVVRFKHRTGIHNNFHDIMYLVKYQNQSVQVIYPTQIHGYLEVESESACVR